MWDVNDLSCGDMRRMDVVFRRLLRSIVGPPGDVDWTLPWHEILHHWNERVKFLTARHGLKTWSVVCLEQYWGFVNYVSTLPRERWVVRALAPRTCSTSWPPCLQLGLNDSILLQAQTNRKLATLCPRHGLFD